MKIRDNSKFIKVILASISIFFLILSYSLINAIDDFVDISKLENKISEKEFLHKLSKELAFERDISSIYLFLEQNSLFFINGQNNHRDLYLKSIKNSNKMILTNQELIETVFRTESDKSVIESLRNLSQTRKNIEEQSISFQKMFFEYFGGIEQKINDKFLESKDFIIDSKLFFLVQLLNNTFTVRSNSQKERGFVSYFITSQTEMENSDVKKWFRYIFNSQNRIFNHNLLSLSGSFNEISDITDLKQKNYETLFRMRNSILDNTFQAKYQTTSDDFFTETTEKIELLFNIEKILISKIQNRIIVIKDNQLSFMIINILILVFILIVLFVTWRSLENFQENIKRIRNAFLGNLGSDIMNRRLDILIRKFEKHDLRPFKDRESYEYFINQDKNNLIKTENNNTIVREYPEKNLENIQLEVTQEEVLQQNNKKTEVKEEAQVTNLKVAEINKKIAQIEAMNKAKSESKEEIIELKETVEISEPEKIAEPPVQIIQEETKVEVIENNEEIELDNFSNLTDDEKKLLQDMNTLFGTQDLVKPKKQKKLKETKPPIQTIQEQNNNKYNYSFNEIKFEDKILLITDDKEREDFFSYVFEELNYTFKTIKNTQNVVFDIRSGIYKIIFIDANLPNLDISELREISDKNEFKMLLILIINSEYENSELENLVDDILLFSESKIITKHIVRTKINDFLSQNNQENEVIED